MNRVDEYLLRRALAVLCFFSFVASMMLVLRLALTGSTALGFLLWNQMLAWIPVASSLWFVPTGRSRQLVASSLLLVIWFIFLPNTFYLLSDFIHLRASGDINIIFDVVLLFLFSNVGFGLGLLSLGVVHSWLRRTFSGVGSAVLIYSTILMCSFAIYLGRYLRWNSWDIIINPLGLLVDISDRVISPQDHPKTISTTLIFFIFISLAYSGAWWIKRNISALGKGQV